MRDTWILISEALAGFGVGFKVGQKDYRGFGLELDYLKLIKDNNANLEDYINDIWENDEIKSEISDIDGHQRAIISDLKKERGLKTIYAAFGGLLPGFVYENKGLGVIAGAAITAFSFYLGHKTGYLYERFRITSIEIVHEEIEEFKNILEDYIDDGIKSKNNEPTLFHIHSYMGKILHKKPSDKNYRTLNHYFNRANNRLRLNNWLNKVPQNGELDPISFGKNPPKMLYLVSDTHLLEVELILENVLYSPSGEIKEKTTMYEWDSKAETLFGLVVKNEDVIFMRSRDLNTK